MVGKITPLSRTVAPELIITKHLFIKRTWHTVSEVFWSEESHSITNLLSNSLKKCVCKCINTHIHIPMYIQGLGGDKEVNLSEGTYVSFLSFLFL